MGCKKNHRGVLGTNSTSLKRKQTSKSNYGKLKRCLLFISFYQSPVIGSNCGENMSCVLEIGKNEKLSCEEQDARIQNTSQQVKTRETVLCNQVNLCRAMIFIQHVKMGHFSLAPLQVQNWLRFHAGNCWLFYRNVYRGGRNSKLK